MLYLKLYESFNKEDFYIKLDSFEFWDIIEYRSNLLSHPDESVYNRLSNILDNDSIFDSDLRKNQLLNNRHGLGKILCIGLDSQISDFRCAEFGIYSMDDDYYFVSYYTFSTTGLRTSPDSEFYKCDQFDGLVKLLKNKGIIK